MTEVEASLPFESESRPTGGLRGTPSAVTDRSSGHGQVRRQWRFVLLVGLAAVIGGILRLSALIRTGGPLAYYVDYDEGVYAGAASVASHGSLPYRDFVFVHPPGIVYLLAPLQVLGPHRAFIAGRLLSVAVGVASILLIGMIAYRVWGLFAGFVGSLIYATFPEAVTAEHGVFLEPFLNLLCLGALACWLRDSPRTTRLSRWALAAGGLGAAAVSIKLWGLIAVVALLASPPRSQRRRAYESFAVGFAVTSALLWLAPLVTSPKNLVDDVIAFQLARPKDGVLAMEERLRLIGLDPTNLSDSRHAVATVVALLGILVAVTIRRRDRLARITVAWFVVLAGSFLYSASYWDQYNAALAPAFALLAACAGSAVSGAFRRRGLWRVGAVGCACLLLCASLLWASFLSDKGPWNDSGARTSKVAAIRDEIDEVIPEGDCVASLEPAWVLGADRLPVESGNRYFSVDSYAAQLKDADDVAPNAATAQEALAAQLVNEEFVNSLSQCRFALLGWRGTWQLSPAQMSWVSKNFSKIQDAPVEIWERKPSQ